MIIEFSRWVFQQWEQSGPFLQDWMYPYLPVAGHEPFIVRSEPTVQPRGFWLTYRLPVSYYSNNTVFYHWPSGLENWVEWCRDFSLTQQLHGVFSYKKITADAFLQTPVWCQYSLWDLVCYGISGAPDLTLPWYSFKQIKIVVGSLYEVIVFYKSSYYDQTWDSWFLKIQEFDRFGVPLDQLNHRIFFQSFLIGYWLYFISDTPWPWRMHYPLELSNWRWFRRYRYFFRTFNEVNPLFFYISGVLVLCGILFSDIFQYILWEIPFKELAFSGIALWLQFLCLSVILWISLARFAKIIHVRVSRHSKVLALFCDLFCNIFNLRRKVVFQCLQNLWQLFSFVLSLYLIFCFAPVWFSVIKCGLKGCLFIITFTSFGMDKLSAFFFYWFALCFTTLWDFFGVGDTILGSFFLSVIRPYKEYLLASLGYKFFLVRQLPLVCIFFFIYVNFIVWPLLWPLIRQKLVHTIPWAFVEEVSIKTRLKYGAFLLRESIKNFRI